MPEWIKILNKKPGNTEVLLYDAIGKDPWDESGTTYKDFRRMWNEIPNDNTISLRINSLGGSIWDGLPIYNLVAASRDRVTTYVEGVAASIASVIAMAGKRVVMPRQAEIFIHEPWTWASGDAEVLRNQADRLNFLGEEIAGIYAKRTGKSVKEMRDLMKSGGVGTSFFGTEARHMGLVDEITDEAPAQNSFDLSRFRRAPGIPTGGVLPPPVQSKESKPMNAATPAAEVPTTPTTPTPPTTPTASSNPNPPIDFALELARVKAALDQEKSARQAAEEREVRTELRSIAAERDGIEPDKWVKRVLADRSVLEDLRGMPARGRAPVAGSVSNLGNALLEQYRGMKPGAERNAFRIEHHTALMREMSLAAPRGDNTFATSLVPDYLSDGLIMVLKAKLAPLNAFSTAFSGDRMRPRATVVVPKSTVGPTVLVNATNFQSGDSTLVGVSVAVDQYTAPFHCTNDQLQKGFKVAQLSAHAAANLAEKICDAWTAKLVVGTTGENGFGAGLAIGAATDFATDDLPLIYGATTNFNQRNLILSLAYLAKLIPMTQDNFRVGQTGAFGFDLIAEQNKWTGALTNTVGFVCDPSAFAAVSGLPIQVSNRAFDYIQTTELSNGMTVETYGWFDTATRTNWASHDVMFGVAVGNGGANGAGKILISA
jgi:ATP-dependent protease ClpP protease subunit